MPDPSNFGIEFVFFWVFLPDGIAPKLYRREIYKNRKV